MISEFFFLIFGYYFIGIAVIAFTIGIIFMLRYCVCRIRRLAHRQKPGAKSGRGELELDQV